MKRCLLIAIGCIICSAVLPIHNAQADNTASVCKSEMLDLQSREQRYYRSIIFGEPTALRATVGHVRFSSEFNPWIKVGPDKWKTTAPGSITEFNNKNIERIAEFASQRGIFQTPRTLTSELVPYLTQAIRAFDCRTRALCEVVGKKPDPTGWVVISTIPGCQEMKFIKHERCNDPMEFTDIVETRQYCNLIQPGLLDREIALLKMATEYDAAYRTLLQFAGDFDSFLREFRFPFTNTLKKASQLIGQFQRIPCFSSSCDEFPETPFEPSVGSENLPNPFPPIGDIPGERRALIEERLSGEEGGGGDRTTGASDGGGGGPDSPPRI